MFRRLAGQVSIAGKNFNVVIFLDTTIMINVKLCTMAVFIELYPFIPLSVSMTVFQGHSSVKQVELKILCSNLIKLKLCVIVDYAKDIMNILFFIFTHT